MLSLVSRSSGPRIASLAARAQTIQRRNILTLKDHKYTARATASGAGRNGHVFSKGGDAAPLDLHLSSPKSLGGSGNGQNPEQLFAAGYSACFLGALQLVAKNAGKSNLVGGAKIHAAVHLGTPTDVPGFGIAVDIEVEGVSDEKLIQDAHATCPYSKALSQGAVVTVKKV